jgi:hypothetical protein
VEWLNQYVETPNKTTTLEMHLDYYNSASIKELIRILLTLEKIPSDSEHAVKVIWHYKSDDELMEARGKEIKSLVDLPFELKARKR